MVMVDTQPFRARAFVLAALEAEGGVVVDAMVRCGLRSRRRFWEFVLRPLGLTEAPRRIKADRVRKHHETFGFGVVEPENVTPLGKGKAALPRPITDPRGVVGSATFGRKRNGNYGPK